MKKKYVASNPQDVERKLCEMFGIDAGNVATLELVNEFDLEAACKKALEVCESHTKYGALLRIAETKAAFKLATSEMQARHKLQVHQAWLKKIANHE